MNKSFKKFNYGKNQVTKLCNLFHYLAIYTAKLCSGMFFKDKAIVVTLHKLDYLQATYALT